MMEFTATAWLAARHPDVMVKRALSVEDMLMFPEARRALTEYGILAPHSAKLNAGLVQPTAAALQKFTPRHEQLVQGIQARQAAGKALQPVQQMYAELMATPVKGGVAQFGPRFGGAAAAQPARAVVAAQQHLSKLPRWGKLGLAGGGIAGLGLGGYLLWNYLKNRQPPRQVI